MESKDRLHKVFELLLKTDEDKIITYAGVLFFDELLDTITSESDARMKLRDLKVPAEFDRLKELGIELGRINDELESELVKVATLCLEGKISRYQASEDSCSIDDKIPVVNNNGDDKEDKEDDDRSSRHGFLGFLDKYK